jgi:hypothetical protein
MGSSDVVDGFMHQMGSLSFIRGKRRMGIYETFTKRKKKAAKQGQADVYQYDSLPKEFRVQVVHIWLSAIGPIRPAPFGGVEGNIAAWNFIHDTLAREVGVFNLGQGRNNRFVQCQEYLFEAGVEEALDLIELSFRFVDTVIRQLHHVKRIEARITQEPDEAIDELNHRFRDHGVLVQPELE